MTSAYDKSTAACRAALTAASGGLVINILAPDLSRARLEFERLVNFVKGGGFGAVTVKRTLCEIRFPESAGAVLVTLPETNIDGIQTDAVFAHLCHLPCNAEQSQKAN